MTPNTFLKKFKNTDLSLHGVRLPSFEISDEAKEKLEVSDEDDNYQILRKLCYVGYEEKILSGELDPKLAERYTDRTELEIKTMKELGFIDYMLLTWDVINFCKKSDIPIGLGRGSAAGSFVLFLLGITNLEIGRAHV